MNIPSRLRCDSPGEAYVARNLQRANPLRRYLLTSRPGALLIIAIASFVGLQGFKGLVAGDVFGIILACVESLVVWFTPRYVESHHRMHDRILRDCPWFYTD